MSRPVPGAMVIAACAAIAACAKPPPRPAGDAAAKAFLSKNATAPGIHVTPSGLQYRILRSGPAGGLRPKAADEIKVDYEGRLIDGEVFDSSYERGAPAVMTVRGLVPGWVEALEMMRPGDQWMVYVPPKLGYGARDAGPIPPGSVLIFKIDLLGVLPDATSVGRG
jgi:peptidylprolyl isomerase/FKBP-type peptidyl-prolyl cis-trans isomerase FklB